MSTETRLKPCPFCGGAAKEYDRFNANVITCRKCGVQVRQSEIGQGDAADRWNKRSAPVSVEPVAWMTHHDEPMLFPTESEARSYCDDDEQPIPLYTAPVAAQPDVTQQTLDDVKAGIPARDAEIEALRKEIEVLRACAVPAETLRICGVIADKIEDGSLFMAGIYRNKDLAGFIRQVLSSVSIANSSYPLNLDPAGIRALTADAISGALALGYQGVNPPPDSDHWLAPFWEIGRESAAQAQQPVSGAGGLQDLADHVVIANATGNPDLYHDAVKALVAGVRAHGQAQLSGNAGQLDHLPDATKMVAADQFRDAAQMIEPSGNSGKLAQAFASQLNQALESLSPKYFNSFNVRTAIQDTVHSFTRIGHDELAKLTESSSQQDADKVDAERWRAYRAAIVAEDGVFLGRAESYLSSLGLRAEVLPTDGQIDAAIDAARKEQV